MHDAMEAHAVYIHTYILDTHCLHVASNLLVAAAMMFARSLIIF
eukprot:COSAG01_NODE_50878_length_359_cov_1.338462_1_plen_43_part_01